MSLMTTKVVPPACAVLMTGVAAAIWYAFGFSLWTLIVGVLLLACPIAVIVAALREHRRTQRDIASAVEDELRRRQIAARSASPTDVRREPRPETKVEH